MNDTKSSDMLLGCTYLSQVSCLLLDWNRHSLESSICFVLSVFDGFSCGLGVCWWICWVPFELLNYRIHKKIYIFCCIRIEQSFSNSWGIWVCVSIAKHKWFKWGTWLSSQGTNCVSRANTSGLGLCWHHYKRDCWKCEEKVVWMNSAEPDQ